MNIFFSRIVVIFIALAVLSSTGCASIKKKFTRKPKEKEKKIEEVVLVPEEYPAPAYDAGALYRQHYLLWKAWQDELVNNLTEAASRKRQLDCLAEAIKNLEEMKKFLTAEQQAVFAGFLHSLAAMSQELTDKNAAMIDFQRMKDRLDSIRRNIKLNFSYEKIKGQLEGAAK